MALDYERNFSWLGVALEIRILTDALIKTVEGVEYSKLPGQLLLFPVELEKRDRFAQLANTFGACLPRYPNTKGDYSHMNTDMPGFVSAYSEDEWTPIITKMILVSKGEPLEKEEYMTLIEFFGRLERKALHLTRNGKGCF